MRASSTRVAGLARQRQRLGQDRAPLLEVADRQHGADAVQHGAAHRRVAGLLGLLEGAREQTVGLGRAAERGARACREAQDGGARRRIARGAAGDQRDRVVGGVVQDPERAEARARRQQALELAQVLDAARRAERERRRIAQGALVGGEQVVRLDREPGQEAAGAARLAGAPEQAGQALVVHAVARRGLDARRRRGQLSGRVVADRLVQAEARLAAVVRALDAQERLLGQVVQDVEGGRRQRGRGGQVEHRLGRLEGEAAAKHRALGQRLLLDRRQERPRPVDGAQQGGLAGGAAARAERQQLEAALEAVAQLRQIEDGGAHGGQLDRQRDAVEAVEDVGQERAVLGAQGRAPGRAAANSWPASDASTSARSVASGGGSCSGRSSSTCSPATRSRSRLVTRIRSSGARASQLAQHDRGVGDQVLEVVEHQQVIGIARRLRAPPAQRLAHALSERALVGRVRHVHHVHRPAGRHMLRVVQRQP